MSKLFGFLKRNSKEGHRGNVAGDDSILYGPNKRNNAEAKQLLAYLNQNVPGKAQQELEKLVHYPFYQFADTIIKYVENELPNSDNVSDLISILDVRNCSKEMELGINAASGWPLDVFKSLLAEIEQIHQTDLSMFIPHESVELNEKHSIKANLLNIANNFLYDVSELQMYHRQLENYRIPVNRIIKENKFNLGELAKSFGLGALAAHIPIIGIPAAIVGIYNAYDKDKQQEDLLKEYSNVLEKCDEVFKSAFYSHDKMVEEQNTYFASKSTTMLVNAFTTVFTELNRQGYKLHKPDKYFINILGGQS